MPTARGAPEPFASRYGNSGEEMVKLKRVYAPVSGHGPSLRATSGTRRDPPSVRRSGSIRTDCHSVRPRRANPGHSHHGNTVGAEEPAQRCRSVLTRGGPCRISGIHADLGRIVEEGHPAIWSAQDVGEGRRLMAGRASSFVAEQPLTSSGGHRVDSSLWAPSAAEGSVDTPTAPRASG